LPIYRPVKRSQIQGGGYVASPCCFALFSLALRAFVNEGGRDRVADVLLGCSLWFRWLWLLQQSYNTKILLAIQAGHSPVTFLELHSNSST